MIVISSNLVLGSALADAPNANNPVVGWENRAVLGGITTNFEDVNFPAAQLANPSTYYKWKSTDDDVQHITVSGMGEELADYFAVANHNFGTIQAALRVQGDSGSGFVDLTSDVLLADNAPVIFRFVPTVLNSIRLRIAPQVGTIPSAAVVYAGKLLVLPRRIYVGHSPITDNRQTSKAPSQSESGHFLGQLVLRRASSTKLDMKNVDPLFFRENIRPWLRSAETTPFFWAWRPGDYPLETGYCWFPGDSQSSNAMANGMMQFSASMNGHVGS